MLQLLPLLQLQHAAEMGAGAGHHDAEGGVGLGLYLCRLIAEAHGGTLVIRNARPGLEIDVSLPLPTS